MLQPAPHTGDMLRDYVQRHRIFQSGWARQQGVDPTTIARFLKQPSLQVDTLFAICQVLKHNFLREIADLLPPDMPPVAPLSQAAEVAALQAQIAELQTQVATLKEALALVGGR
jgi:hypothetical protein